MQLFPFTRVYPRTGINTENGPHGFGGKGPTQHLEEKSIVINMTVCPTLVKPRRYKDMEGRKRQEASLWPTASVGFKAMFLGDNQIRFATSSAILRGCMEISVV
jgi:hypothetical protein